MRREQEVITKAASPGRKYYVCPSLMGRHVCYALGPFDTHVEALQRVNDVRNWFFTYDLIADWRDYHTCSMSGDTLPEGWLNAVLGGVAMTKTGA